MRWRERENRRPLAPLVPVPRPCLCWCLRLRLRLRPRRCLCPYLCENRRSPTSPSSPASLPRRLTDRSPLGTADSATAPASGNLGSAYPFRRRTTQYPKCICWSCFVVPSGLVLSPRRWSKEEEKSARHTYPLVHCVAIHYIRPTSLWEAAASSRVRPIVHYPVLVVPWM